MLESLSETTEESAGAGGKGVFAVPDPSMHVSYERSGSDDADGSGEMTPELVAIHDGARCLVTPAIISRAFADAETYGAAVCAMPVKDTIKIADEGGFAKETPDRRTLFLMQTPQTFSFPLIHDAYEAFVRAKEREENGGKYAAVTDDAEVLEWMTGKQSFLSEGSYENIKITTPEDMLLAEAIIKSR
ncbi:MAG: 2-C-methyl-D-erythritol 4-phosphate cytidylyltransferase [Lachnospiraceae bacterium]|nr:2-C-methyl-D-erythritol 4-phosphate cytidylyltransferase [Lachnospiraceae bacterium]